MAFFAIAVTTSLTWNSQAEVIVKKFDPPFQTGDSVFAGDTYSAYSTLNIRVDSTGTADFQIPYSFTGISFSSPTEIIVGKEDLWENRLIGGLAFGSTIGENIVEYEGNGHVWSSEIQTGQNIYFPATLIQSVVPLSLDAEPPSVGYVSEIRGREGIIGFKFQHEDPYGGYTMHYGYFHFDFSENSQTFPGEKGYLLGWAYESEPNKPIIAEPLNSLSEAAASPVSDFTYEILEGQDTITAYTGSDEHVVNPSEIEGLPVIEIPAQVEKINNFAFAGCLHLSRVTLPASVTEIGASVFIYCPELTEISVSENNPNYSSRDGVLFDKEQTTLIRHPSNRAIVEYIIPETVKKITDRAFDYCKNLLTVVIPAGLTTIDPGAFERCSSLQRIDIPNTVTNIGMLAFTLCLQLKEVNIGNGVTHIESGAFRSCPQLREIIIPDNVLSLGDSSFAVCTGLETVRIGNGGTEIKGDMFGSCFQLKEVFMGNDVTLIDSGAFLSCTNLVNVSMGTHVTHIGTGAFFCCSSLTNLNIGNDVTIIEKSAFDGCTKLQEIALPDTVTHIGNMAFRECTSLTNVVIPDSVLSLGPDAFDGCLSLKNVVLGDGISNFLSRTFAGCVNLETVKLGAGLTSPGAETFSGCLNLKRIDVSPDSPFLSSVDGILFNKTMSQLVFYPPNHPNTEYTVPDGVKEVYGFGQCINLKRVTLPFSVEKISSFSQSVTDVYFKGNAPNPIGSIPNYFTIHYLKGTVGWNKTRFSWLEYFTLEPWTLPADEPELFLSKRVITDNETQMTLVFGGILQKSSDLVNWEPVETASPYQVKSSSGTREYYRGYSEIAD
jgi:hypothetical protein